MELQLSMYCRIPTGYDQPLMVGPAVRRTHGDSQTWRNKKRPQFVQDSGSFCISRSLKGKAFNDGMKRILALVQRIKNGRLVFPQITSDHL